MTTSALSPVDPGANGRRLRFYYGPMDCGKSTLALQMDYNQARQGRRGLVLTRNDRSMGPRVTSRIGLAHDAIEVTDDLDLVALAGSHAPLDYLICDEACFYTEAQVEQLADLVDLHHVDVFAFGLATDFRTGLFPASRRLFELADEVCRLQVEVLCWCGRPGLLNARIVNGVVARQGAQVVIGDTSAAQPRSGEERAASSEAAPGITAGDPGDDVRYQVLCRRHHRAGDLGPGAPTV